MMFLRQRITIFKLAFRWEVQVANIAIQNQRISFLFVALETIEDFIKLQRNTFRGSVLLLLVIKA